MLLYLLLSLIFSLPAFPNKKTFGNMEKQLLEKRRQMFDSYLKFLLLPSTIKENFGLIILLERFLDHSSNYERDTHLRKAVGTVKSSVKSVKRTVTSMPNNLINTVGLNLDGLKGALNVRFMLDKNANTGMWQKAKTNRRCYVCFSFIA